MEVKKLNTTHVTILEYDWVPLSKLLHRATVEEFISLFAFSSFEIKSNPQNQPAIQFTLGVFNDGENDYSIRRIEVEDRKIIIEVESHSDIANMIFLEATRFLQGKSGNTEEAPVVVRAIESIIIAKMNFLATKLVDQKLLKYVDQTVTQNAHIKQGVASANLFTVNFRIDYQPTEEKLSDYRIGLTRKEFFIGPRDGTPLSEQVFISSAPFDTDKHLEVMEDIEKMYS